MPLFCATALTAATVPTNPVALEFPYQYFPENLPGNDVVSLFSKDWKTYGAVSGRNAAFSIPASAPAMLKNGVQWSFAGAGAIPLNGPPLDGDFKTTACTIGMPVGVSVVQGILYVGDDNGYTYAINAVTGKLIWAHYGWNMNMSNPLVDVDGILYVGTGDGHVYKLNAATGKLVWKTDIESFVSLSSPVAGDGKIFLGGTYPNYFYALDQNTGKITWKTTIPDLVATGMGDCTPAFAEGMVLQEATVNSGDPAKPVANVLLAMDAATGKILWQYRMKSGEVPPAMKTATPMINAGVVYAGSPADGNYYAFDLKTGRKLWEVHLGSQIRAGAAVRDGVAYVPYHSGDIAAIQISDGKLLGQKHIGGSFGPSSPVIVGGTLYVSNVFGWVNAIPLRSIAGTSMAE